MQKYKKKRTKIKSILVVSFLLACSYCSCFNFFFSFCLKINLKNLLTTTFCKKNREKKIFKYKINCRFLLQTPSGANLFIWTINDDNNCKNKLFFIFKKIRFFIQDEQKSCIKLKILLKKNM